MRTSLYKHKLQLSQSKAMAAVSEEKPDEDRYHNYDIRDKKLTNCTIKQLGQAAQ